MSSAESRSGRRAPPRGLTLAASGPGTGGTVDSHVSGSASPVGAMHDQASQLRELVDTARRGAVRAGSMRPRRLVVGGGKGGVGATTAAVLLAAALVREGRRTLLVDGDFAGPDVASLCRLPDDVHLGDVLAGRRSVHEALVRGPAGMLVLPGGWSADSPADPSPTSLDGLADQLDDLADHLDVILIDAGSRLCRATRRFWQAADAAVLVTTPDHLAVMDAYASIKALAQSASLPPMGLLVNRASAAAAAEVQQRLATACRRFLAVDLPALGHLAAGDPAPSTAAPQPDRLPCGSLEAAAATLWQWTARTTDAAACLPSASRRRAAAARP